MDYKTILTDPAWDSGYINRLIYVGINTVISLIYYLRVAKTVCIDPEPANRRSASIGWLPAAYVFIVSLPVVFYGIYPVPVQQIAEQASKYLLM